jgi:TetR/AcrR family transcriptional regulator, regulator of biofilm formation and stress response
MARISADERRQGFIEAAVRIIAAHGMRGATTRRIAEEAGSPLATLHYCFHTKEQLYFAVFQHLAEETSGEADDEPVPAGLSKAARRWLTRTAYWTIAHDDYARAQYDLYFWALRQEGNDSGLAAEVYELFFSRIEKQLRAALLPQDDDTLVVPLARLLIGLNDGLVMQWNGNHDRERFDLDFHLAGDMVEAFVTSRSRA